MKYEIGELEKALGIPFQDPSLLQLALTHRSYVAENLDAGLQSNERLEFLGDAVLAFVSTDFLYRTFTDLSEGELTDLRASLIRTETLAHFARDISLEDFLLLGKGDQNSGAGKRVLAATFEAVLGAIYLDQGIAGVQPFLLQRLEPMAHTLVKNHVFKDNKSLFQQLAQAHDGITPSYRLVSQEGPSHEREFTVEVMLGDQVAGRGQGRNKRTAEQEAAHVALLQRGWV